MSLLCDCFIICVGKKNLKNQKAQSSEMVTFSSLLIFLRESHRGLQPEYPPSPSESKGVSTFSFFFCFICGEACRANSLVRLLLLHSRGSTSSVRRFLRVAYLWTRVSALARKPISLTQFGLEPGQACLVSTGMEVDSAGESLIVHPVR